MLHFQLVLSAAILAAASQEQELVINPVPRALVAERTEQFTFEKDFAEFRAPQSVPTCSWRTVPCWYSARAKILTWQEPSTCRGSSFGLAITMKTTHPGALACYWTTPSDPQFSERRVRSVHLVPDGTWQQVPIRVRGTRRASVTCGLILELKPADISSASVEIIGFAYHPLEIDRAKQTKEGVLFRVRNRGNQPVRCRHRNEVLELGSPAKPGGPGASRGKTGAGKGNHTNRCRGLSARGTLHLCLS